MKMTGSKTIRDEILGYDLPDMIKSKAIEIYDEFIKERVGTCRSSIRKQLLFFLVYNAYIESGQPPIQSEIVQKVNVDESSVSKALKDFNYPRTNYRMKTDNSTPKDYIPHFARVLGIREDAIDNVLLQSDGWISHPKLKKMPTVVVTAAILKYYMDISGIVIDWKQMSKIFNLSKVVIENAYNIVSQIDNQ